MNKTVELTIKNIDPATKAALYTVKIMNGFSNISETIDHIMDVYNEKKE